MRTVRINSYISGSLIEERRRIISVIAFAHHKGGTGKTTSCIQIAGALTRQQKKVLVVDTDPQANATIGLGIHPDNPGKNIYHVYMSYAGRSDEQIHLSDIIQKTASGIDLVPSHLDLAGAEPFLYGAPDRYRILKQELASAEAMYDYILIDTPPFLGQFVLNGVIAADYVVMVFSEDNFALCGYENLKLIFHDVEELLGKKIRIEFAILNRWDVRKNTQKRRFFSRLIPHRRKSEGERASIGVIIEEKIQQEIPRVAFIPPSSKISDSLRTGIPLAFTSPDDPAAREYARIADLIIEVQEKR